MASLTVRALSRPRPIISTLVPRAAYTTPSNDYIPGKRGYAPGFEPPKLKKKPTLEKPLSSPPPKPQKPINSSPPEGIDLRRLFRDEMRQRRHQYSQELLKRDSERSQLSKLKREAGRKHAQVIHDIEANAREKAVQREKELVHELELNKEEAVRQEKELIHGLELDTASASATVETVAEGFTKVSIEDAVIDPPLDPAELRAQTRLAHFLAHNRAQSEERLSYLIKLYHSTEHFVTRDNLEEKLDEMIQLNRPILNSLEDLNARMVIQERGVDRRMEKLKEVLEGKVMGNMPGLERLRERHKEMAEKDAQPAEPVTHIGEEKDPKRETLDITSAMNWLKGSKGSKGGTEGKVNMVNEPTLAVDEPETPAKGV